MARLTAPKDPRKRAAWIQYQLKIHGSSFADLARKGNATRQTVRRALYTKYPKWDRMIAETIGCAPADIFPERYAA